MSLSCDRLSSALLGGSVILALLTMYIAPTIQTPIKLKITMLEINGTIRILMFLRMTTAAVSRTAMETWMPLNKQRMVKK